jgi:hypothetical protein
MDQTMQNSNSESERKLPVIEAIESHPQFQDEAFLERVTDLLTNRAPDLLEVITAEGYRPDGYIENVEEGNDSFCPASVLLPATVVEDILGLEPGDVGKLVGLGILEDVIPQSDNAPWVLFADVLTVLEGEIPEAHEHGTLHRICKDDVEIVEYEIECRDGECEYVAADAGYIHRLGSILGEQREAHMERLNNLCDHEDQTISCELAEYLLGLKRGDLELLAEIAAVAIVPGCEQISKCHFYVADLILFLNGDVFFAISQVSSS